MPFFFLNYELVPRLDCSAKIKMDVEIDHEIHIYQCLSRPQVNFHILKFTVLTSTTELPTLEPFHNDLL